MDFQASNIYRRRHLVGTNRSAMWIFGSVLLWWTRKVLAPIFHETTTVTMFIHELIVDPKGRSLRSIFKDPGYSEKLDPQILEENQRNQRPLVRRKTKRLFMRKGVIPLPVVRSSRLVLSHAISVDGESTWLNNTTDLRVSLAMDRARLNTTRVTHRLLVEPYEYVRKRLKKPPDGSFWVKLVRIFHSEAHSSDTTSAAFKPFSFLPNGITFVIDNCANAHICSNKKLFIDELKPSGTRVLTANGPGEELMSGTIRISWDDDTGTTHTYDLPDVLYSPESTANIISITKLGEMFGSTDQPVSRDESGTCISSNASYSEFTWDHKKYKKKIIHGNSRLPELQVNAGYYSFASYVSKLRRIYDDAISYAFTTEIDNGLSSESAQSARDFEVGDSVNYISDGKVEAAKYIRSIPLESDGESQGEMHEVVLSNGLKVTTDASHLTLMDQADLTNIPLDAESYCKEVGEGLTKKDIAMMARPKVLTPLQQEFMHLHEKMYHTPFHVMIRLARTGVLPKRFLKLRNDTPICISCNFGKAHKRPWLSKGKRSSPIRKESDTQVGDCVSTDQIVSAQPGLIPQMNGFLTSDRIRGVTVFVDHASDFTYGHLMRSLDLEETLSAKQAFETLFAQAGHTVKRYHADNGRYPDQGFLASINSNDQTITFCGVGAHHQNGIVERGIRLITETARTLLLHAQRHWPEYITTMLWPFAVKAAIERINYLSFDLEGKSPASCNQDRLVPLNGSPAVELASTLATHHSMLALRFVCLCAFYAGWNPTPTWEEMCKNSTELATEEAFELAETWFNKVTKQTSELPIIDPFQVVAPDQFNTRDASASEGAAQNPGPQSSSTEGAGNVARRSNNGDTNKSNSPVDRRVSFGASRVPGADGSTSAAASEPSHLRVAYAGLKE
eukprot:scaffold24563_cov43-Cyclotella_meneghiniana.AAC.8